MKPFHLKTAYALSLGDAECDQRQPYSGLREEELLDIVLAEGGATARALAVARLEVLADAVRAEHVPALGDDHALLALVTHIAAQQCAHRLQLLRVALSTSPPQPLQLAVCNLHMAEAFRCVSNAFSFWTVCDGRPT